MNAQKCVALTIRSRPLIEEFGYALAKKISPNVYTNSRIINTNEGYFFIRQVGDNTKIIANFMNDMNNLELDILCKTYRDVDPAHMKQVVNEYFRPMRLESKWLRNPDNYR
jgi:hypothetical protein